MKKLLLVLCLALIACPAFAQIVSYSAPLDKAIWSIDISAPVGSTGTYTLNLDNGETVAGSWSYQYTVPPAAYMTSTIGSDTDSETFLLGPIAMQMQIWNGDNVTYARQLKCGFGQIKGIWNKVSETTIGASPVRSYTISSDRTITVSSNVITYKEALTNLNPEDNEGLLTLLTGYTSFVIVVFGSLIYWLKFLFVDHLVLTISLYLTGTMAYAINTSRDIFRFYKTWFKQQRAMFEFVATSFQTTFQIVTQVAAVIGNALGTVASVAAILIRSLI